MLDEDHRRRLREEGYSLFPRFVQEPLLDRALRCINARLGETDLSQEGRAYGFMEELTYRPELLDLFQESSLPELCREVLGGQELEPVERAQVALRFPLSAGGGAPEHPGDLPWHLDGLYNSQFGAVAEPFNFSLLVGVFLNDLPTERCGNFTVYPKGHWALAEAFRERGGWALEAPPPRLEGLEPLPLRARRGDCVLCHHQVPHLEEPINTSPWIRYAVFFRVNGVGRPQFLDGLLTDPLLEWTGVRESG